MPPTFVVFNHEKPKPLNMKCTKIIKTLLLGLLFLTSQMLNAQTIFNINGTVTDANGQPVPNIPMTIQGDSFNLFINATTTTDANGQYSTQFNMGNATNGFIYVYPKDSCIQSDDTRVSYSLNVNYTGVATKDFTLCAVDECTVTYTKNAYNKSLYSFDAIPQGAAPFKYTWNFGDGSPIRTSTNNNYYHIFDTSGTFNVSLTVEDAKGRTDTYTDNVIISTNNTQLVYTGTPDTLTGGVTYRSNFINPQPTSFSGAIVSYDLSSLSWAFSTANISNINNYYQGGHGFSGESGQMYSCISVENNAGQNFSKCTNFYANFNSDTLVVKVHESPTNTNAHRFYGRPIGTGPFTYSWDFGDGNTGTEQDPHHAFTLPGIYNVCLTATDSAGKVATECISVTSQGSSVTTCNAYFTSQINGDTVQFSGTANGGLAPYTYSWNFGDYTPASTVQNPTHVYTFDSIFTVCLTITDSIGCSHTYCEDVTIFPNAIIGNVYHDTNTDCALNAGETTLGNVFLQIVNTSTSDTLYNITDTSGHYEVRLDNGTYEISPISLSPYWQSCPPTLVTLTNNDTVNTDLGLQALINCSQLKVQLSSPTLVYCYSDVYEVNYCNVGTIAEPNTYVEVELDPYLIVNSSSIPYTQNGNVYTFQIGNVNVNKCGSFTIDFTVDCNANLGQIHCTEANIFPNTICLSNNVNWNGATIVASASCLQNDSIQFKIENIGGSDMTQSRAYFVIEDQILRTQGSFNLNIGEDTLWTIPATTGKMYFLQAEQEITHPMGNNLPMAVSFDCNSQSVNPHLINQFSLGDAFTYQDVDCQQNVYSFDPNDKQGFPIGYGENHFITANDKIEYRIRFQNTGTFTAFNVVVEDEIDLYTLDLTTLEMQGSSHSYELEIVDGNTLRFVFNNINLPDSTSNEPESHGFIRFKIAQKANNPIGTVIHNSAAIYFDFNAPVITNMTTHTIGEDFIQIISSLSEPQRLAEIKVFPNPFKDRTTFKINSDQHFEQIQLNIFDIMGRKVKSIQSSNSDQQITLERDGLTTGVYFYQLQSNGKLLDSGKVVVQ